MVLTMSLSSTAGVRTEAAARLPYRTKGKIEDLILTVELEREITRVTNCLK